MKINKIRYFIFLIVAILCIIGSSFVISQFFDIRNYYEKQLNYYVELQKNVIDQGAVEYPKQLQTIIDNQKENIIKCNFYLSTVFFSIFSFAGYIIYDTYVIYFSNTKKNKEHISRYRQSRIKKLENKLAKLNEEEQSDTTVWE